MWKKIKKLFHVVYISLLLFLLSYMCLMHFAPNALDQLVEFKLYAVLTNSMEPTIPTYSLIISKSIKSDEVIEPQTIITFKTIRDGDEVFFTHYYEETQVDENGDMIYRTHAEGKDNLDDYKTYRNDIMGTYVYHIPYLGKFFLFMKSTFGLIMVGELIIITLMNALLKAKMKEKEDFNDEIVFFQRKKNLSTPPFEIKDVEIQCNNGEVTYHGIIANRSRMPMSFVRAQFTLFDDEGNEHSKELWYIVDDEVLLPEEERMWSYTVIDEKPCISIDIAIASYKSK